MLRAYSSPTSVVVVVVDGGGFLLELKAWWCRPEVEILVFVFGFWFDGSVLKLGWWWQRTLQLKQQDDGDQLKIN
jgi:hypothetical protein